jgi:DNA-binding beta-propeller fold protein YncE
MDRRLFLKLTAGGFGLAAVPGCSIDAGVPGAQNDNTGPRPLVASDGPSAEDSQGRRFAIHSRRHALFVDGQRRSLGVGRGAGQLNYPTGLALAGGLCCVVECGNHRVQLFDESGGSVGFLGENELLYPSGIAAFADDEILVADSRHARVLGFRLDGTRTRILGEGLLSAPRGLAVHGERIFVADAGLGQLLELDAGGLVGRTAGFTLPYDLAVDDTSIYVADAAAAELAVIDRQTRLVTRRELPAAPTFVCLSGGALHVG